MDFITKFRTARLVGVPLIGVGSFNQTSTVYTLKEILPPGTPAVVWDCINGIHSLNKSGSEAIKQVYSDPEELESTQNPVKALVDLLRFPVAEGNTPTGTVAFMLNIHRHIDEPRVAQAISNLRDIFKMDGRTLVLLSPHLCLPQELIFDIVMFEDTLPDDKELRNILGTQFDCAGIPTPEESVCNKCVDALRGLSTFSAEQVVSLSLTTSGIDMDSLWRQKKEVIKQTKGLEVSDFSGTFSDIGGLHNIKGFLPKIFGGNSPPTTIIVLEELEKMLAGASGPVADSSGVSQDALGVILTEMEDNGWIGSIFVGPSGSGKSLVAKAAGNTFEVPTIKLDLGAMKTSLLGESEQAIRAAMKVIKGVAGENALFIATSNNLTYIPPELRRRFRLGTWMFDLPTKEEKIPIWEINLKKHSLCYEDNMPNDVNWTGADIRSVCEIAWRCKMSLVDASNYITPVGITDRELIENLRKFASGKYLSSTYPGIYNYEIESPGDSISTGSTRKIMLRDKT